MNTNQTFINARQDEADRTGKIHVIFKPTGNLQSVINMSITSYNNEMEVELED